MNIYCRCVGWPGRSQADNGACQLKIFHTLTIYGVARLPLQTETSRNMGLSWMILVLACFTPIVSNVVAKDCDTNEHVNGCSIPFGISWFYKAEFTPDCNKHDVCYWCVSTILDFSSNVAIMAACWDSAFSECRQLSWIITRKQSGFPCITGCSV